MDPSTNTAGAVVDDADADDDDRAHEPAAAAKNRLAELLTPRIFVREVQRRAAVTRVDVISGNFNQIDLKPSGRVRFPTVPTVRPEERKDYETRVRVARSVW